MKRKLLGKFRLEDPNGKLHVSNIFYERDRLTINSCQDGRFKTYWERDSADRNYVTIYWYPNKKVDSRG